jgi:hypothetical protein
MRGKEAEILKFLKSQAGMQVDIWAAQSIAAAFDRLGMQYPKTAAGAPSFTKSFLDTHEHPMAKMILEARELNKTHGTFLEPYLKHSAKDGRIHTHFNQMRNEDGGTVTGRLSASNPNLQQVPARHEIIGPMVRGLFLPEDGDMWAANDFSSQEPRLLGALRHPAGPARRGEDGSGLPRQPRHGLPPDGGRHGRHQTQGCQDHRPGPDVRHGQSQAGNSWTCPWTRPAS